MPVGTGFVNPEPGLLIVSDASGLTVAPANVAEVAAVLIVLGLKSIESLRSISPYLFDL